MPISEKKTSIVYSIRGKKKIDLKNIVKRYNSKYKIIKFDKVSSFKLELSNLRSYRSYNILSFGDSLHKLHPLAGQGYNMTIRDIQIILRLIKKRIELGLELNESIFIDFEKNMKHKNFLFSSGIDFIYEFFNFESKVNTKILSQSVKLLGENKFVNRIFSKFADKGMII